MFEETFTGRGNSWDDKIELVATNICRVCLFPEQTEFKADEGIGYYR